MEWIKKLLDVPWGHSARSAEKYTQQHSVNTVLDEKPTMHEMARATKWLKDGKNRWGRHSIKSMEILVTQSVPQIAPTDHQNMGGSPCTTGLERDQHRDHLQKGYRTECGNYRGIYLPSLAGKLFAWILLNRLSSHFVQEVVTETHCGFHSNRSTVDMIFCPRELQEKCLKQNRPLYIVFVDLTNAFDPVKRNGLCQLLRKYDCP